MGGETKNSNAFFMQFNFAVTIARLPEMTIMTGTIEFYCQSGFSGEKIYNTHPDRFLATKF